MIPVQMIRVGGGDDAIQVPVFRLPYVGGRDAFGSPGGFFTNKDGEYGVIVDASLAPEDVADVATEEIRKNLSFLQKLVREQVEALKSATAS
ncbi:MAG: hypothetical protein ACXWUG_11475 [Polyangiales bacterium]